MKNFLKKFALAALFALLCSSCGHKTATVATYALLSYDYSHSLQVGSQTLTVEIAQTSEKMTRGLSDRISMADSQGMLFDFGTLQSTQFWMKDMQFPLDFIWIAKNKIIGITPDVPAPRPGVSDVNLTLYPPPAPVDWVLEVNAGWAEKNNVRVGDVAELK